MRKITFSMLVSLDGRIARPNGELDWFLLDEAFEEDSLRLLRSVDGMFFGRVSYELLATYWPSAGTRPSSNPRQIEFARLMNSIPKIVFSRTLTRADWGPAVLIRDDVAGEVRKLKEQPGKDLVLFAGAALGATFMKLDLIDDYRLAVLPIVLGAGISLFEGVAEERKLELTTAKTFPSGIVVLEYRRDRRGSYDRWLDPETQSSATR
jgi:dihydrofolate reductase